jgi:hypothetical protein
MVIHAELTFRVDGGGVRGYSSLLILERLMAKIRDIETQDDLPHASSSMCSWSTCYYGGAKDESRFLMHHYVDYFFGTSTGG